MAGNPGDNGSEDDAHHDGPLDILAHEDCDEEAAKDAQPQCRRLHLIGYCSHTTASQLGSAGEQPC